MKISPFASVCVLLWGASILRAQTYEVSVFGALPRISPAGLGSLASTGGKNDDTKLKANSEVGARLTWNTRGYFGHEVGFTYIRATLQTTLRGTTDSVTTVTQREDKIKVRQLFYNFMMYFMPSRERWRPFFTVGGQAHEYSSPGFAEWTHSKSRRYGFNYGGGLKINLFKHALVRIDARDYFTGKPYDLTWENSQLTGGMLRQQEYSAGFAITF